MKVDLNLNYSGFSDEDLEVLVNLDSHKAIKTGDNTWQWKRIEKGSWSVVHNIEKESRKAIYSFIIFNIAKWEEELMLRQNNPKKVAFFKEAKKSEEIYNISQSKLSTREKVREILSTYPETTALDISEVLYIGVKTIYKHIKALKPKVATKVDEKSRMTETELINYKLSQMKDNEVGKLNDENGEDFYYGIDPDSGDLDVFN